jgi:hypothetical protein
MTPPDTLDESVYLPLWELLGTLAVPRWRFAEAVTLFANALERERRIDSAAANMFRAAVHAVLRGTT